MEDIIIATYHNSEILSLVKAENIFTIHSHNENEYFQIIFILTSLIILSTNTFLIYFILKENIFSPFLKQVH